ncbi:unnamed protein product [Rhizoctonia solani]|uniref:Uncharacterized protein n=1 Tax=Rhizoctonia solani TaxID=456999 RepID=A0A8H3DKZ7_9AGAM|nr:unnamed protein product [Rhizoctonia solani]CAE6526031.1 unnamed protein product [Rhizoctonia solani]
MRLRIYGGYLADYRLFNSWCEERAKADPLFAECYEEHSGFGELTVESYAKKKKLPWRRKLSVDYLPCQKNESGDIDLSQQRTIFAFRDYDYDGLLAKFSRWALFQETDTDREYKAQIEELGIELGPWTVVSYVGLQGIFYNFSPEVVTAILERMKAKNKKIQEMKAKKAAKVAHAKKGEGMKIKGAMRANPVTLIMD